MYVSDGQEMYELVKRKCSLSYISCRGGISLDVRPAADGGPAEAERKRKGRWTIEYSMDDGRDAVMDDGRWQVAKAERGLYSLLTANTPTL